MNILHLSDIHFRRSYPAADHGYAGTLYAMQNPLLSLTACADAAKKELSPDLVLISGDLTEDGDPEDYRLLKQKLTELFGDTPLLVTLGNHDCKEAFRRGWSGCSDHTFSDTDGISEQNLSAPWHTYTDLGSFAVISFDSSREGCPNGLIDSARLDWLSDTIIKNGKKPFIFMTHHHLLPRQHATPSVSYDARLTDLLKNAPLICTLTGHTHYHFADIFADHPYYTTASLSFRGENISGGIVRFEEVFGYSFYRLEGKALHISEVRNRTFSTGKHLGEIRCGDSCVCPK
ncbi:MAG: metallophosphoesterase [Eubacteriales bacterium]|nr:metallophosphoesterase [Eubacteriales bacterium]